MEGSSKGEIGTTRTLPTKWEDDQAKEPFRVAKEEEGEIGQVGRYRINKGISIKERM